MLHPSLKIADCREYLEVGLSGFTRNYNLIHSDLFASGPSILSTFFTLETKAMENFSRIEIFKAEEDLENLLSNYLY
jgi:hypothetical protein